MIINIFYDYKEDHNTTTIIFLKDDKIQRFTITMISKHDFRTFTNYKRLIQKIRLQKTICKTTLTISKRIGTTQRLQKMITKYKTITNKEYKNLR